MALLGIEKLKALLKAGLTFGKNAAKAFDDKKISFFEAVGLIPEAFAIVGVAKTWAQVQQEINDLDEDEKEEINKFMADEFDIPNSKVELFIEHSLTQIIALNALVYEFKHLKDPV
jgi:hypothetical protein